MNDTVNISIEKYEALVNSDSRLKAIKDYLSHSSEYDSAKLDTIRILLGFTNHKKPEPETE